MFPERADTGSVLRRFTVSRRVRSLIGKNIEQSPGEHRLVTTGGYRSRLLTRTGTDRLESPEFRGRLLARTLQRVLEGARQ